MDCGRRRRPLNALNSLAHSLLLALLTLPGVFSFGNVTLQSITIFRTHEWLGKPSVYFQCKGEAKIHLDDVVEKDQQYVFIGKESWQPLTELEDNKCKRCGVYEEDRVKMDDIFDEWELCLINFSAEQNSVYTHSKTKEFNATFLCFECRVPNSTLADETSSFPTEKDQRKDGTGWIFFLTVLCGLLLMGLAYVGYTKWQQKIREERIARFYKLFNEDDDLDEELGFRDL